MAIQKKEIALSGRLITAKDPTTIGVNDFSALVNMRYGADGPKGIAGMSAVNSTALSGVDIDALHFFRKDNPVESHLLAHANGSVYRNGAVPPATGNFDAAMFSDATGAGDARFGDAPNGAVTYCNGKDTAIWFGTESPIGAVLDMDPSASYKYDHTDAMLNSLQSSGNTAVLHRYADSLDANTLLMLHMDGTEGATTFTDSSPSTPHTVTAVGDAKVTTATKKFGTASAVFDNSGDWLTISDDADFDLSGGNFTIDFWVLPTTAQTRPIFYQQTDASNYIRLESTYSGGVYGYRFVIYATGSAVVTLTASAPRYGGEFQHVAVVESGDSWYLFINGSLAASATDTSRAANYTGLIYIGGDGTNSFPGYLDEFRVSNVARWTAAFTPPTSAYGSSGYKTDLYVGSILPIKGAKFYVKTANTSAATVDAFYWNGSSYAQCGSVVDGTSAGGKTLAQTGSISFTDTVTTAKLRTHDDVLLFWYKFQFSGIDAATEIYWLTLLRSMQQIQDTWSGDREKCVVFAKYVASTATVSDYTSAVQSETWDSLNDNTFADLSSLTSSDYVYAAFNVPVCGLFLNVTGSNGNKTANSVASVEYWDGTAWVLLTVQDSTTQGGSSLGKSGSLTWSPLAKGTEQRTFVASKSLGATRTITTSEFVPNTGDGGPSVRWETTSSLTSIDVNGIPTSLAFYYRIRLNNGTTAETHIYNVSGIPSPQECRGYSFAFSHSGRLFLCDNSDGDRNAAAYSASGAPTTFNGADSGLIPFGDGVKLVAGASLYSRYGSDPQNVAVVAKSSQTWMLTGDTPETMRVFCVSDRIGCIAPKTMCVGTMEVQSGFFRRVAVWLSQEGVVICDGNAPINISADISDKFDPSSDTYLGAAVMSTCTAFIDVARDEYHLVVPGVCEWVYDFKKKAWWKAERGTGNELECGCAAYDANGVAYSYGASDDGVVYLLESGTTMNGDAIACTVDTADVALNDGSIFTQTTVLGRKLVGVAKTDAATVTLSHYVDSATAADDTETISQVNAGNRIYDSRKQGRMGKQGYFHRWRMSVSTTGEATPFEPLFLGVTYETSSNL